MREIIFRGKRIDNGEWVEGDLFSNAFYKRDGYKNCCYILDYNKMEYDSFESIFEQLDDFEVDPETVSQYTGLNDKNGKRIFEGDIVKEKGINAICIVFDERTVSLGWVFLDYFKSAGRIRKLNKNRMSDMEIIGNRWDNSELLEVLK